MAYIQPHYNSSVLCDDISICFFLLEYGGGLHIIALREEELGQNSHTQRTRTRTHTRLHHLPVITGLTFTFAPKTDMLRPAGPTPKLLHRGPSSDHGTKTLYNL